MFRVLDAGNSGGVSRVEIDRLLKSNAAQKSEFSGALVNVVLAVGSAIAFAAGLFYFRGTEAGLDFLAGVAPVGWCEQHAPCCVWGHQCI